ncbi:MAG: hypothetical protein EOM25_10345, partial [Deltaproteobacteria bacterium]|nr:hypothetical protein [Deltaproteobacteria bacterium]
MDHWTFFPCNYSAPGLYLFLLFFTLFFSKVQRSKRRKKYKEKRGLHPGPFPNEPSTNGPNRPNPPGGPAVTVLLDSIDRLGLTFKRAATTNGGEWHGPCPACGGTDRCHVWPEQGEAGTWWCRGCDQGGDAISWLQAHEGKTFPQAAELVGRILDPKKRPKRRARLGVLDAPVGATHASPTQTASTTPTASPIKDPAQVWQAHAWQLVNESADRLQSRPDQVAWLSARGISAKTAALCKLGWIEERGRDVYRARAGWGLPERLRPDGTPKKLWIPRGLSIPYWRGETMLRIRIRRAEGEPRYLVLEGSATDPMPPMLLKGTAR